MGEKIEFSGSGKDILELIKKALCEFKEVYVVNAFLHPHHGFADEGRAVIDILINVPEEKEWVEIHYSHHESPVASKGSGSISYEQYYYHRTPFPKDRVDFAKPFKFTWGYNAYIGEYILNEILERKKCRR